MTDAVQIAIVAAIPPTLVALCGVALGVINRGKISEVHQQINSRMTELLELTRKSSRAEGAREQREHDQA